MCLMIGSLCHQRLAITAVTEDVHIATDCNESVSISIQFQTYQSQTPDQTKASSEDQITEDIENASISSSHDF